MVSAGQLSLLLVLSSLLLCSLSAPQSSTQQEHHPLQKRIDMEKVSDTAKCILKIAAAAEPLIALIPKAGPAINTFVNFLSGQGGDTDQIIGNLKAEFKKLNEKLDNHHVTIMWNTWASGPYQEAEINIMLAWKKFNELLDECKGSCIVATKNKNFFKELHENMESAPEKLHLLLNAQQPSFITDFGKLLADHVRCHEKSIKDFTLLIAQLMYMGSTISDVYYHISEVNRDHELNKITYETSLAMFKIHKHCILHPDEYIKKDTVDLIDENQDRSELAKDIRSSLEQTFDRYDWLVVAFITRNSKHSTWFNKLRNRHYLSGFTEVTKGEVSVAVAKQVKGSHKKAKEVMDAITKCLGEAPDCDKVIDKLNNCQDHGGTKLRGKFTAVHSYISKSHDSVNANEKEQDSEDEFIDREEKSTTPYIYRGDCKKNKFFKGGHFRVMIKSDEEMKNEDPCKNMSCGGKDKGQCVPLRNVLKAVCECKVGFQGEKCEERV